MKYKFSDLLQIMATLRGEGGCPWDIEQTHESVKNCIIEEAYEVIEAIDGGKPEQLYDELGDLLLQVVFHAQIGKDEGEFDIDDVTNAVCERLIRRHPHVFGNVNVEDSQEVLKNWDEIKKVEKREKTTGESLRSVSAYLPALMRAQKVQKKAARVNFDWDSTDGALDKLREELCELTSAIRDNSNVEEELGDLLFSAVNVARFTGMDAEEALTKATEKFVGRFEKVERTAKEMGRELSEMSLAEMDEIWNSIK